MNVVTYKTNFLNIAWVFLCVFLFGICRGQSIQDIKNDAKTYFWGEGSGSSLKKADNEALDMLSSQIAVQVESRSELFDLDTGKEFKQQFKSIINTYSNATIKTTERIVIGNEPDVKVFRYIKRSETEKIFAERKEKIIEFSKNGTKAIDALQAADALKYYYWALLLLKSHPDGSAIKNDGGELLATWLPAQLNGIFSSVSVLLGDLKSEENYAAQILQISYKDKPVSNLDYSYWNGKDWSNIVSAKDGLGVVEFNEPHPVVKEVRLKIEYEFEGESAVDKELQDVMQKIDMVPFRNSFIVVKPSDVAKNSTLPNANKSSLHEANDLSLEKVNDAAPYRQAIEQLKNAINSNRYDLAEPLFTESGYAMFRKLIQYGQSKILEEKELRFVKNGDVVSCRSIPMSFSFKKKQKEFVEKVVLEFDKNRKINSLALALGEKTTADIANNKAWPITIRWMLIRFMENYRTAYALKRLDYIEKIFSDDALIINGIELEVLPDELNRFQDNQIAEYNKHSKAEYLEKLKKAFGYKEFINLKFDENNIRKSGKGGEVYGIQIKQSYVSSNYSDSGYLFLLIDFSDPKKPTIPRRNW